MNPASIFNKLTIWLYQPKDASSLGIIRFLYGKCIINTRIKTLNSFYLFQGLLMVCDIIEERGGAIFDIRWGETRNCHFPLLPFLAQLELKYIGLLYGIMWIGEKGCSIHF